MKNAALTQEPTLRGTVAADGEPGNNSAYDEYLRGFDEIPVLQDVVQIPPPRPRQPEFRRGERRDARQEHRPDGYSLREATLAEIEFLYHEYTQPTPAARRATATRKKRQKRKTATKSKKR